MNKKRPLYAGLVPATFILIFFSLFFISCTTEVTLTLQPDNSVKINFEGGAGEAFTRMISSASGVSGAAAGDTLIDADSLSYELAKAGFADVKVNQAKGGLVTICMSDKKQSSYIFTSGILKSEKGNLKAAISRKSLRRTGRHKRSV